MTKNLKEMSVEERGKAVLQTLKEILREEAEAERVEAQYLAEIEAWAKRL